MKNRHLCRICLCLAIWFAIWGFREEKAEETLLSLLPDGGTVSMEGTVYRLEETDGGQRIYLDNISVKLPTATILPENSMVYLKENETVSLGNRVTVQGICTWPDCARNPGGFDAKAYYGAMGISFYLRKGVIRQNDGHIYPVRETLRRIRSFLMERLLAAGDGADAGTGILGAMLLGDQTALLETVRDLYRDAGIIHILAISGLHISMTGMALYGLLRKLGLPFCLSTGAAGAVMAAYVCMIGFRASAVRAVLMFGLFLLAQTAGRTYDCPTALSLAAALLLAARPENITQAGFLLSFLAICGVLHGNTWESGRLQGTALGTGISVQLVTLPLIAHFYSQVPLYALPLNLLVLPLMPLVMGFGIAGMAAALLHIWMGQMLLAPAQILLKLVEGLCTLFRRLPFSSVVTGKISAVRMLLYYGIFAAACILFRARREKNKKKEAVFLKIDLIKLSFALILLAGIFFVRPGRAFTMTFLDVGQGDGCCVENTDGTVFLIDGGSSSDDDIAGNCIEPFLKSRGIDTVDFWMLSHYDADHVNGLLQILSAYEKRLDGKNAAGISIGMLLLPPSEENSGEEAQIRALAGEAGIPVRTLKRGDRLQSKDMLLTVLSPDAEKTYEGGNEASVIARIDYGGFSALFTGDVEGSGEADLIESGLLTDIDVLKVAHHGSRYTTSQEFLTLTKPQVSVISCGEENVYGHPHQELLERLGAIGSKILRTDRMGAVMVTAWESGAYVARTML